MDIDSFVRLTVQEDVSSNCSLIAGNYSTSQLAENSTSAQLKCLGEDQQNQSSGMKPDISIFVWFSYILCGLAICSIVGNCLPIAAIVKHETLHKPVYILMANLAASDICTGVSLLSLICTGFSMPVVPEALLRFYLTTVLLSALTSAYSLLTLTAERHWFIVHGMTYVNKVTNERCLITIAVVWVWSGIFAMLPNFGWNCTVGIGCMPLAGVGYAYSYLVLVLMLVFIPMAAIVGLNVSVFWCLWQQVSAIRRQEAAVHAQHRTSRKSSITVLIITILFLVGWLPFCIKIADGIACKQDCGITGPPMLGFVILNSALNPIVYGFRLKDIRRGIKRLFFGRAANALHPTKRTTAFVLTTVQR
ncbi:G-protein coupled receptor 6 [Branchiostoma belcheri]|nr:G-protein coupled receptor 6 [Branchiostoma belcheri]